MVQNLLTIVNSLSVVTNFTVRARVSGSYLKSLSGADACGRCKRRPYLFLQNAGMNTLFIFYD